MAAYDANNVVKEVYVIDAFMRALCEFRTEQDPGIKFRLQAVPLPCSADEPLGAAKKRLFQRVKENFDILKTMPRDEFLSKYGPGGSVRPYAWATEVEGGSPRPVTPAFFAEGWSEANLEWLAWAAAPKNEMRPRRVASGFERMLQETASYSRS